MATFWLGIIRYARRSALSSACLWTTETLTSEVLPFLLTIHLRSTEAQQLYLCLHRIARNSCMHLIGATLRPSKLGRSPLAQYVDKLVQAI